MTVSSSPVPSGEPVVGRPMRATTSPAQGISPSTSGRLRPALGEYRISQKVVSCCFSWLLRGHGVIGRFKQYLEEKARYSFRATGKNKLGHSIVREFPYVHRWTKIYRKSILAKFYQLDEWVKTHQTFVTHFTLTVYQSSKSKLHNGSYSRKVKGYDLKYQESLDLLLASRKKLLDVIRHRYPGINYVWVMEAHETGYPHCHLLMFREFSEAEQNSIKDLWALKYQAGSRAHGVKVTSSGESEKVLSMKNYLMKYMDKQFSEGTEGWTEGDLLFNAMMWETKTRMWGTSKELTAVMKRPDSPESGIVWDTIELVTPGGEFKVWSSEDGTPLPVLDDPDEQDPDWLCECEESCIWKVIWDIHYNRINTMRHNRQMAISYCVDSKEARRLRNNATSW